MYNSFIDEELSLISIMTLKIECIWMEYAGEEESWTPNEIG
jgi:hypothetical protein